MKATTEVILVATPHPLSRAGLLALAESLRTEGLSRARVYASLPERKKFGKEMTEGIKFGRFPRALSYEKV